MTHPALGCLVGLVTWAAAAGAIAWLLQAVSGASLPGTLGVSLLAGLIAWMAANLLWGSVQRWREASAIAGGIAGVRPVDGQTIAYSYTITEDRGTGRRRTILTHFKGVGLAPSTIVTASGSYALLAVCDLEEAETGSETHSAAVEGFRRHAAVTTFTGPDTSAQELIGRWTHADGAYRSDVAYAPIDRVDFTKCQLSQHYIRPGASVTVFGPFSSAKNSIVPSSGWRGSPRLVRGNPEQVVAALRSTARTRLVLGVLATAASAGLVAAFVNNG